MMQTAERLYGGLAGASHLTRSLAERVPAPVRTPFDSDLRRQWLLRKIQEEEVAGKLVPQAAEKLYAQAQSPQADRLVRDVLLSTIGANAASFAISLPVSYLLMRFGYESLAILTAAQTVPVLPKVSIAGILRAGYLAGRVVQDHLSGIQNEARLISKKAESVNLLVAVTSPFGNFSAPWRMAREMPELSKFLTGQIVGKIPVIGSKISGRFYRGLS